MKNGTTDLLSSLRAQLFFSLQGFTQLLYLSYQFRPSIIATIASATSIKAESMLAERESFEAEAIEVIAAFLLFIIKALPVIIFISTLVSVAVERESSVQGLPVVVGTELSILEDLVCRVDLGEEGSVLPYI
jgi:hypothetical protein